MRESQTRPSLTLSGLFCEKTVIVRTATGAHCVRLRRGAQAALAAGAFGLGLWSLAATGMLTLEAFERADHSEAMASVTAAYDARLAAMTAELASERAALAAAAARAEAALAALTQRHDAMTAAAGQSIATDDARGAMAAEVAALRAERDAADVGFRLAERRAAEMAARAEAAEAERADLQATLHRIAEALEATVVERDDAEATAEVAAEALGALEADVTVQRDRQAQLLAAVERAAALSIAPLQSLLGAVGVDVERVLEDLRREQGGSGGPFIPFEGEEAPAPLEQTQASAVIEGLDKVRLLRSAVRRMPFGAPVVNPRYTSQFGVRADPLNRRRARHDGLDMAGPRGAAIFATAGGEVVFAGVQRGYGKVVRIRHAFGFETLYAHLNRIGVRVGERVGRGARIGDMGNTGRSTGTHLHYEVRVNGNPVNPMKFIEAASNVL